MAVDAGAVENMGTFVESTVEGGVSNCGAYTYVAPVPLDDELDVVAPVPDPDPLDELELVDEVPEPDPLDEEELPELVPLPLDELPEDVPDPEPDELEDEEEDEEDEEELLELEDTAVASAAVFSFSVLKYCISNLMEPFALNVCGFVE